MYPSSVDWGISQYMIFLCLVVVSPYKKIHNIIIESHYRYEFVGRPKDLFWIFIYFVSKLGKCVWDTTGPCKVPSRVK